eukprot:TRINITY_DN5133_c0_g1_i1.p1 TRINITY_DN5133_c0_g1~~TRINITY_DN5133_c0_g1_i1.p1  ORF type:complete len:377 (+),score=138.23 TRINITY_DN5133_c0_g1_i1:660-1790(+)
MESTEQQEVIVKLISYLCDIILKEIPLQNNKDIFMTLFDHLDYEKFDQLIINAKIEEGIKKIKKQVQENDFSMGLLRLVEIVEILKSSCNGNGNGDELKVSMEKPQERKSKSTNFLTKDEKGERKSSLRKSKNFNIFANWRKKSESDPFQQDPNSYPKEPLTPKSSHGDLSSIEENSSSTQYENISNLTNSLNLPKKEGYLNLYGKTDFSEYWFKLEGGYLMWYTGKKEKKEENNSFVDLSHTKEIEELQQFVNNEKKTGGEKKLVEVGRLSLLDCSKNPGETFKGNHFCIALTTMTSPQKKGSLAAQRFILQSTENNYWDWCSAIGGTINTLLDLMDPPSNSLILVPVKGDLVFCPQNKTTGLKNKKSCWIFEGL